MPLRINSDFDLPIEAVTQTFAILAKRGAGKSYAASVMVEEMLDKGLMAVVIDPLGVWYGLQSSADGKSEGYPITVLGGDHGNVPLEPTSGEVIADFVVQEQQPVVMDLSHFRKADQTRFTTAFAERLYQKNRDPLHLVVDEADLFAPQSSTRGHESRMLGSMEDLARRGRARGIGMTLVTQRSAVLNKNVLTQIEVLIAMRTTSPQDRKAIKAWVDVHGEEDAWKTMDNALPRMAVGTAYIWSPGWLDVFEQVNIRKRRTFDSSATPKVGEKRIEPRKRAEPDLDALRDQIADTIERAKQEDPRLLRQEIGRLRSELAKAEEQQAPEVEVVEIFPEPIRKSVIDLLNQVTSKTADLAGSVEGQARSLIQAVENHADVLEERADVLKEKPRHRSPSSQLQSRPKSAPPSAPEPRDVGDLNLRAGARRMLELLGRMHPLRLTRSQLATMTGMAPKGGTFNTYYGVLRRNGLMSENGSGRAAEVSITEAGFSYLGTDAPRTPLSTEERLDMWRSSLRAGARAMLDVLVDQHPNAVLREDLADAVDMTVTGGTFNTYLGTLRRNGLAEVDGQEVRAGEALFVGAHG